MEFTWKGERHIWQHNGNLFLFIKSSCTKFKFLKVHSDKPQIYLAQIPWREHLLQQQLNLYNVCMCALGCTEMVLSAKGRIDTKGRTKKTKAFSATTEQRATNIRCFSTALTVIENHMYLWSHTYMCTEPEHVRCEKPDGLSRTALCCDTLAFNAATPISSCRSIQLTVDAMFEATGVWYLARSW